MKFSFAHSHSQVDEPSPLVSLSGQAVTQLLVRLQDVGVCKLILFFVSWGVLSSAVSLGAAGGVSQSVQRLSPLILCQA